LDEVRRLRKLKGLTQVELAELAGVSAYTVTEIETGHREPRPSTLRKLADALDAEVADFFPKAPSRSSAEPPPEEVSEKERRLSYLRITRLLADKMRDRWEKTIERNTFRYEEWNEAAEVAIEMDQALGEAIPVALWRSGNEWLPKEERSGLGYAFVSIEDLKRTIERASHAYQSRFGEEGVPNDVGDLSAVRARLNQETRTPQHTDEQARGAG
jgi:transcriptional regulator with XRE-family HTH domain